MLCSANALHNVGYMYLNMILTVNMLITSINSPTLIIKRIMYQCREASIHLYVFIDEVLPYNFIGITYKIDVFLFAMFITFAAMILKKSSINNKHLKQ